MRQYLLTILILLPVVGALAVAAYGFVPGARRSNYRVVALLFSLATFAASLLLLGAPVAMGTTNTFHFVEDIPWI
ncbi:MAG: NADH-quinone oxidoreductase subunit M, partial [Acidobacteria bacterium]